jgi:hypothetical protein
MPHLEEMLGQFVLSHAPQEHPADAQVDLSTSFLGNQQISRLLDPVMHEFVTAIQVQDESGTDCFPERSVHRFLGFAVDQR